MARGAVVGGRATGRDGLHWCESVVQLVLVVSKIDGREYRDRLLADLHNMLD